MATVTAAKIIIPVDTNADKATKSMDKLDDSLKDTSKTVKNYNKNSEKARKTSLSLGKVVGGVGLVAVFSKLSAAIKENNRLFAIQEKAEAKVEAIVKATGQAAGFTADEMKAQAAALQRVTTTGDEVILQGQAIIATFKTISGDVFKRTTETALDLSAAFGQDIKSSAIQLGKALEDPITGLTALRRIGVSFTEKQKATIKALSETNRLADAQGIILDVLEQQVGGTARALAQTASGQIQQFNNAWGDVRENLGRMTTELKASVTPGLGELVSELGEATKEGSLFDNFIKDLAKGLGLFAKQIADTIRLVSLASNRFNQFLNTEAVEKLTERYEILQDRAADAFGGGTEGLKKFLKAANEGNKKAVALQNELNRVREKTSELTGDNNERAAENEKLIAKITKRIDDNSKAVDNLNTKTQGSVDKFKNLKIVSEEAAKAYKEAISILADTGDLSAQLKDLEIGFKEQQAAVKKAGLDTTALTKFQLKQRENLFSSYFETIANDQSQSISDREDALKVGLNQALKAEETTAKDRLAIQAAYTAQSEKLNQEWLQNLAQGFEKYSVFATSTLNTAQSVAEFLNNDTLQQIEDLKAVAAQRDEAAEKQESLLEKSLEDLKDAGATRAEIIAAEEALEDARTANAEAKAARDKEIADKDLALRKKQAKQQKIFGIFTTLIDTAIAFTKTLASLPFPANTIAAGLIAVEGAAQTAAIANTPIPGAQFGGEFTVPPGNPADSGLLKVNQGEDISVRPARESGGGRFPEKVVLMVDGKAIDAVFVDSMNKNLNNGKVQSRRGGVFKTA